MTNRYNGKKNTNNCEEKLFNLTKPATLLLTEIAETRGRGFHQQRWRVCCNWGNTMEIGPVFTTLLAFISQKNIK